MGPALCKSGRTQGSSGRAQDSKGRAHSTPPSEIGLAGTLSNNVYGHVIKNHFTKKISYEISIQSNFVIQISDRTLISE